MRKYIYLCGPIMGCTDEECKDWRQNAKKMLNFPCVDPMLRDYRGKEIEYMKEIVEADKIDIDSSSHLLVNYDKPSVGTSMEIIYAWERGKTVIVVAREGVKISPWLIYHSHKIFHSFDEAIAFLNEGSESTEPTP